MDETIPSGVILNQDKKHETATRYHDLPRISEILSAGDVSPKILRNLFSTYQQAGIEVRGQTVPGSSVTNIDHQGKITTEIPQIAAYGNDMVAFHEAVHIEQIVNALNRGLTPEDLSQTLEFDIAIAEIGAHTFTLKYYNQLSRRERRAPGYKDMKTQAEEGIRMWSERLPANMRISDLGEQELLDPYKSTIDLPSSKI